MSEQCEHKTSETIHEGELYDVSLCTWGCGECLISIKDESVVSAKDRTISELVAFSELAGIFLLEMDGSVVWIRDDYLSMGGIAHDENMIAFLGAVAALKGTMRQEGVEFSA